MSPTDVPPSGLTILLDKAEVSITLIFPLLTGTPGLSIPG
jgi:hypothetical protein